MIKTGFLSFLLLLTPVQAFASCGTASWYGQKFHGRKTASGERFNKNDMTAAHRTLPFGSIVNVRNQRTGKVIRVRINDRGPFIRGRIIDLSEKAAKLLGIHSSGIGQVCITY